MPHWARTHIVYTRHAHKACLCKRAVYKCCVQGVLCTSAVLVKKSRHMELLTLSPSIVKHSGSVTMQRAPSTRTGIDTGCTRECEFLQTKLSPGGWRCVLPQSCTGHANCYDKAHVIRTPNKAVGPCSMQRDQVATPQGYKATRLHHTIQIHMVTWLPFARLNTQIHPDKWPVLLS